MLQLADSWLRKANGEQDPFNRYISLFVSYNAIYNIVALQKDPNVDLTTKDGQKAIDAISTITDKPRFVERLKPDLLDYLKLIPVFREEYWGKGTDQPISENLRKALERNDIEAILTYLMEWLYKVRCNVFHGVKQYGDRKQEELLGKSCALLERIILQTREAI